MNSHLIFDADSRSLKLFNYANHALIFRCEARNDTVNDGYGHYGKCPPGVYGLGDPEAVAPPEVPYGSWFIPLIDTHGYWLPYQRDGIGIHGGGSGLADPFAPVQGWQITEGCIRVQNQDLAQLARLVRAGDVLTVC